MESDSYRTIAARAEAVFKDKSSKFYAFAFPVSDEGQVGEHLDALRKKYYDATHHCYAWRMGADGGRSRVSDDGEPSGTAGKPILGQIVSQALTDILIVVVRYFGGTKLGTAGLINAYRESAREAIGQGEVIEKTVDAVYAVSFPYMVMNEVMKIVKDMGPGIVSQKFDNICEMELSIRRGREDEFRGRLQKCEGVQSEFKGYV